jgi:D-alanine-D-alanine ligase
MGSSVSVSRAASPEEFAASVKLALRCDLKVLVERSLSGAREIECSVLEELSGEVLASKLGEIVPSRSHGFYSCDAKYIDLAREDLRVPAIVPPHTERRIRNLAVGAFQALCCEGMARADFFLAGDEIFINEVNTLPGFTRSACTRSFGRLAACHNQNSWTSLLPTRWLVTLGVAGWATNNGGISA